MNRPPEHQNSDHYIETAVAALERMADAADATSEQALNAARRKALQGMIPSATSNKRPSRWLWAAATAAALALAVGIAWVDRNGHELPPAEQLVADAELYQQMEFYLWLSEELESE